MPHSAPVVAFAMTGAEPFASGSTKLSIGGALASAARQASQTIPGSQTIRAITYVRGRNMAKPAGQDP